jgi:CHASE2 domain-containing sensor protein
MAHKKGQGSSRNGRDSNSQRLGVNRGIAVALLCWAALSALQLLGAFDALDLRLLDWRFQLRGTRAASDRIAIVEIDDATVASKAIAELNGRALGGRSLKVNEAKPQESRSGGGGGGGGNRRF